MAVLIIGPNWIGDMVLAQSLAISLKQHHPEVEIDILAPSWSIAVASRMSQIRHTIVADLPHGKLKLKYRYQLAQKLKNKYTQAFILPMSLKSALIPTLAKIPCRTGWRGEIRYKLINDLRILEPIQYPQMVDRYIALAYPANTPRISEPPQPQLHVDKDNLRNLTKEFNLNNQRPIIALCPGAAYGPSKRWPVSHWIALANNRISAGWHVYIFGSLGEAEITQAIAAGIMIQYRQYLTDFAGKISLTDSIDMLSSAQVVVSNDSGLMHIAASVNCALVAIYGATPIDYTPPLAKNVITLSTKLSCQPCRKKTCRFGHYNCLHQIDNAMVDKAINNVLALAQDNIEVS